MGFENGRRPRGASGRGRRGGPAAPAWPRWASTIPAALRSAGDKQAHDWITAELAEHRPDDAVLSEEASVTNPRRGRRRPVWIVEPAGTARASSARRAARTGRLHIALWERGSAAPVAGSSRPLSRCTAASLTLSTAEAPPYPVAQAREAPLRGLPDPAAGPADRGGRGDGRGDRADGLGRRQDRGGHPGRCRRLCPCRRGQWEWDNAATRRCRIRDRVARLPDRRSSLEYNGADPNSPTWWFVGSIEPRRDPRRHLTG